MRVLSRRTVIAGLAESMADEVPARIAAVRQAA